MKKVFGILAVILFIFCNSSYVYSENSPKQDVFVARLDNGLGNQMFLLASQYAYAKHFNKELCLAKPFHKGFKIPFRLCTDDELEKANETACFFYRFSNAFFELDKCSTISHGYLQDERFFASEKEFVKDMFQFIDPLPEKLKSLADEITNQNSVSVHIRRGDYLMRPRTFPTMPLSYYEDAADHIQAHTNPPIHLFVFSDDTKWVKKNFKSKYPFTIVPKNSTVEDMHLMSLCKHNIIANSTYSWWAAYLNKNPDKIVVAPGYWSDVIIGWAEDIVLKDWVILPVKREKNEEKRLEISH